jgi:asparagine synthase (glutamine-hydrolysing)
MCGIVCSVVNSEVASIEDSKKLTQTMLESIKHRGSDDSTIVTTTIFNIKKNVSIGHNRLAINDLSSSGNQPFVLNGKKIVVNGEIWNHEELRTYLKTKGYNFKSNSDCEVILPLYELGELDKLDGMFSFIILDKEKVILCRDWVGKIPLWMVNSKDGMFVSSEIKSIKNVCDDKEIKIVPKNSLIVCNIKHNRFDISHDFFGNIGDSNEENLEEEYVANKTYELLKNAVEKRTIGDVKIATLNSGGIDSSVITYLLSRKVKDIKCYTVKFDENSPDLKHARLLAEQLGIELVEVDVPRDEKIIKQRFVEVCNTIEYPSNVQVQVGIMLSFIGEQMEKDGVKVVFSGEGSDESAGSYGNYRMWSKKPDWCDVKKEMFEKQHYGNLLRGNNIFMRYGTIECRTPFFDREYVNYVCNLPEPATTGKGKQWKKHLADAFRGKIPNEIIDRPKEAFQKGTCFKTWFEEIILNDKELNKNSRKKLHYVIQDIISDNLKYNIRKCKKFEFNKQEFKDIKGLFV